MRVHQSKTAALSWATLLFVPLAATFIAQADEEAARKVALIIGIEKYDDTSLNALPLTQNDTMELAKVLSRSGYKVIQLTQAESRQRKDPQLNPTAQNIDIALKAAAKNAQDTLLVAFAGHGVQLEDKTGAETAFILPADADLKNRTNVLAVSSVYETLKSSKASTRVLMIDAARNNPFNSHFRGASDTLPRLPDPPGALAVFFSCSAGQTSVEDRDLNGSVFFHFVVKGLSGDADLNHDGQITLLELTNYVTENVYSYVRKRFDGALQLPEFSGVDRRAVLVDLQPNVKPDK